MSFNAKNLSYEKKEPAFLRRLKSQYGDGSVARQERPNPRPAKPRLLDDDDGPTYVVEGSNDVISKEEYERLVKGESEVDNAQDTGDNARAEDSPKDGTHPSAGDAEPRVGHDESEHKREQKIAEIGASKKRKQPKVVLDEKESDEMEYKTLKAPSSETKSKQKKKIKLSFLEE
ncbi:hypothetical protein VTO42DRAFT_8579 [Malbranchea cinnamomea]